MNIAQLSEQLKDVPQAKLVDYAKNPNSMVPQFLALAEIQRRQRLMAAQGGQAPQTSVAEDIMAAEAPRMSGVAALPTRAMFTEQGMAGGGIVAFAEGGDAEEEYEEYLAKARRSRLQGLQNAAAEMGSYLKNPLANLENRAVMAQSQGAQEEMPKRRGSHPLEDKAIAAADKVGLDRNLMLHALYKETGGHKSPETAVSKKGAQGPMQLMPATAKELGVNPQNTEENLLGGAMYLKRMLDKYQDPSLALAAYNAGPGRVDRALKSGQGIAALPNETRMYIAGYADGGEVKRFKKGDEVEDENEYLSRSRRLYEGIRGLGSSLKESLTDPKNYDLYRVYQENIGQPFERGVKRFVDMPVEEQAEKFRSYSQVPDKTKPVGVAPPAEVANKPTTAPVMPRQDEGSPYLDGMPPVPMAQNAQPQAPGVSPAQSGGAQPATSQSYFDALMKNIESQAEEAKKQGDQNKYLALMQAGFGMLGSTSPFAATGIGQGAMTGVGTYAGLEKERRAQERSLMAAQLGLAKAKSSQEEAEELRKTNEELRKSRLEFSKSKEKSDIQETALARYNQDPSVKRLSDYLKDVTPGTPEYNWIVKELERRRNNALAESNIPGYRTIPNADPFPTAAKKPGFFESLFGGGSSSSVPPLPQGFKPVP